MDNQIKSAFDQGAFAITLLVKDLPTSMDFYGKKLGLEFEFSDETSAIYQMGFTYINLLIESQWQELVAPAKVGDGSAVTAVYTLRHSNVDLIAEQLEAAGVALLNGPMDRSWGVRTLSFQDPDGHVFEVANHS